MVFAETTIMETSWLGKPGDVVYFVAESLDEIRKLIAKNRENGYFKNVTLSELRERTEEELKKIGLRWLDIGIDWIRHRKERMEICAYYLGNTTAKEAAG